MKFFYHQIHQTGEGKNKGEAVLKLHLDKLIFSELTLANPR